MPKSGRRGYRHGPPPWWPDGEEWPPPRHIRPAFRKRLLFFLLIPLTALIALVFAIGFTVQKVVDHSSGAPNDNGWNGPPIAGIIVAIVAIFFLVRFLRRATAPIADVMAATERVAEGEYATRVEVRGPRDARRMAQSFNEMAARLESNEEQRRRLLADVTHELRTPLSIIRGNVEGMLDGLYDRDDEHLAPIVEETRHMARLLDDLHTLATAEARALRLHKEPTDVSELLRDVVAAFTPRALESDVTIELDTEITHEIDLDPVRIRQVVENVLANAIRYTPAGGSVRVQASVEREYLSISVTDTGPGVPSESLPHLFDRFTKSADSGGSGLGLAIARSLTEVHGGNISARNAEDGGLVIQCILPVKSTFH